MKTKQELLKKKDYFNRSNLTKNLLKGFKKYIIMKFESDDLFIEKFEL